MAGRLLQGTPEDEAATTGHTVTATNSEGVAESGPFNITIIEIPDVPVWTSPITPPQGQVGQQYNYNLQAHLNTDIATISVVGGSLPDGLNIVGLSIEGTPTADGDFTGITLEASNTQGADISDPFSIEIIVASVQWITQPAPPDGIEGDPYLYNLAPHLNFTDDVVITVSAGFLPDGIDVVDLALQGIPTEPGEQTGIQLTATNPGGDDESDAFSIDIESVFFSIAPLSKARTPALSAC